MNSIYHQTLNSKTKLIERIEMDEHQYHLLDRYQRTLDKDSIDYAKRHNKIQKKKDEFSIKQEKRKMRLQKLSLQMSDYQEKCEHYARKQCAFFSSQWFPVPVQF